MTTTHHPTAIDAATRQHRRIKQGLVATWIHEISARHGTATAAEKGVETVTVRPLQRRPERALA